MPRIKNPRSLMNENDENSTSGSRIITRAKSAALNVDELAMPTKALQSKKTAASAAGAVPAARRRAALGDVSNVVSKNEVANGKKVVGKAGLVSKLAQPSGVQKKAAKPRSALEPKEPNSRIGSTVPKRKNPPTSANPTKEVAGEGEPQRKRVYNPNTDVENKAKTVPKPAPVEVVEEEPVVEAAPPAEYVYPEGVNDLDTEDLDDPLMVAEYANEIFEYLRDLECSSVPNPQYMSHQDDLEWKTRGILIDWLIEVHTRFHLLPETLFLAVNTIDRFLSEKVVQLDRLQLVGITAMFIASKYEEVLSPHIANFRHVADDGFTETEILSAERFILSTLNYDLSYPNPMNFLRRISKADNYDIQSRTLGKYLMEISLLDHRFMAYRPSHVAAGAMYLARLILDRGEWDETIAYYAGYTEEEIEPVFQLMVDYLARPVVHEAFFKKYASKKFMKASIITRNWARKNAEHYDIVDTDLSLDQIS
ncbi:cyclin-like protein [Apodospora peruviana]|uniref:Cyclin-like protein n=1 Tax=Apodospora peruviana TaxID=516989 RepID=A0AAE0ISL2_9PEZI|nr:cyclin-like protein [Apodospora peruviana]